MELDMVTYPSPDPEKCNFLKPSQLFCVTVDSKNPEEAVKFIDFLVNSQECNEILLCERGILTNTKMGEAIIPKLSDADKKAIEFTNNVIIPTSSQVNPAPPEGSSEVSSLIGKMIERVCYQEISAEDAAQEIFEQGNEIMAANADK